MKKERLISLLIIISLVLLVPLVSTAGEKETFLIHLTQLHASKKIIK